MSAPILASCYFGDDPKWQRLARALRYTAARWCHPWDRRIVAIEPAPLTSALGIPSHVHNTQKMEFWASVVAGADDGARVLLIDADTIIRRSLDAVWDEPFDLAYTTKASRYPFNSGVVFLRVSPVVRAFIETWRAENQRMLGDKSHHQAWRLKYGGINQASLGHALDTDQTAGLRLLTLPCQEWNCEDSSWASCDATTRIVHVKSLLRRAIFYPTPLNQTPYLRRLKAEWTAVDGEAAAAEADARQMAATG